MSLIGFLLNDKDVGIYSFASLFIEGFITLIVMQNIYNPIFSKIVIQKNINKVNKMITKIKIKLLYSTIIAIFLILYFYLLN